VGKCDRPEPSEQNNGASPPADAPTSFLRTLSPIHPFKARPFQRDGIQRPSPLAIDIKPPVLRL
jgi:hypothetical protein